MIPSLAAAACGGALLALAFPPMRWDLAAWVALVPLFWAIDRDGRPAWCALYGLAFGAVFSLLDVSWIYRTLVVHGHFAPVAAVLVFLGMVLALALFPGALGLALGLLRSRGFPLGPLAPFFWTATEYARAVFFTGFPWDLLGYSQIGRSWLIQVADLTGVYGISFVVALVNVAFWEILRSLSGRNGIQWRLPVVSVLTLAAVLAYGSVRIGDYPASADSSGGLPVGMLQGNIAQEVKWEPEARNQTLLTYEQLGREACHHGARLLVWPETSIPVLFGSNDPDWQKFVAIGGRLGVPMLVGAPSERVIDGHERYYNSAFLVERNRPIYRYDKIHLVPFGEYMPLTWLLPLGPGIAARQDDYSAGKLMTVMRLNGLPPFSVLICYEAIFPELARMAVNDGAKLLINLTNDAWFGHSAAPYQHVELARMRSVENRVWMLRIANTGVSAAFDPAGRVVAHIALDKEGYAIVPVPSSFVAGSFYSRFGDLFAWACLGMTVLMVLPICRRIS
jgi:apolipoprotein N-acyltransferase